LHPLWWTLSEALIVSSGLSWSCNAYPQDGFWKIVRGGDAIFNQKNMFAIFTRLKLMHGCGFEKGPSDMSMIKLPEGLQKVFVTVILHPS
jgi:hypothetical protein